VLNGAEVVLIGYNAPPSSTRPPAFRPWLRMFHTICRCRREPTRTLSGGGAAEGGLEEGQALLGAPAHRAERRDRRIGGSRRRRGDRASRRPRSHRDVRAVQFDFAAIAGLINTASSPSGLDRLTDRARRIASWGGGFEMTP